MSGTDKWTLESGQYSLLCMTLPLPPSPSPGVVYSELLIFDPRPDVVSKGIGVSAQERQCTAHCFHVIPDINKSSWSPSRFMKTWWLLGCVAFLKEQYITTKQEWYYCIWPFRIRSFPRIFGNRYLREMARFVSHDLYSISGQQLAGFVSHVCPSAADSVFVNLTEIWRGRETPLPILRQ